MRGCALGFDLVEFDGCLYIRILVSTSLFSLNDETSTWTTADEVVMKPCGLDYGIEHPSYRCTKPAVSLVKRPLASWPLPSPACSVEVNLISLGPTNSFALVLYLRL